MIKRRMPSPAMVVALAAFAIAIGGVAFATIPDSTGSFHGCVAKASGNLRIVESEADCRANERPVAWNQAGPPGPPGQGVVARMRSGPVGPLNSPGVEVPLSGNTWEQGAEEFQKLEVQIQAPNFGCSLRVNVVVDAETLVAFDLFRLFGLQKKIFFDLPMFETGSPERHTLTMQLLDGGNCLNVESVKVDVLGFE